MTAPPNPPTPPPSQSTPTPIQQSPGNTQSTTLPSVVEPPPPVTTKLGTFTQKIVMNVLEFVDQVLYALMGPLGRTVFGSIQDAIALGILLKFPSLIGEIIIGKDLAGADLSCKRSWLQIEQIQSHGWSEICFFLRDFITVAETPDNPVSLVLMRNSRIKSTQIWNLSNCVIP